jgi:hypothetical protein
MTYGSRWRRPTAGEWLAELLEDAGYELHLARPLRTKAIAAARVKTDAVGPSLSTSGETLRIEESMT